MSAQETPESGSEATDSPAQPSSSSSSASESSPSASQQSPESESAVTRSAGPGKLGLVLVALLALLALAVALYPWIAPDEEAGELQALVDASVEEIDQRVSERFSALAGRLDELDRALTEVRSEQENLASRLGRAESESREISTSLERQADSLEALENEVGAQLQELWQQEGQQREADREFERRMRLLEAASLLRLGQERAELAADWPASRSAYERAEQLVRAVDDPRLGQVRRLLATELAALESVREPEWERWQVRLSQIADSARQWPIRNHEHAAESTVEPTSERGGWLGDIRAALGRLVTVSRRDELELPADAVDSLREQLQLRLVAAELALVRRNLVELGHQLRATFDLIDQWFDPDDADVRSATERLRELESIQAPRVPEGLGEALRALQSQLESA